MQKFEILLSSRAKSQHFSYFHLKSGQRGIGRSNLVLYDLTWKTKLPRVSLRVVHCIVKGCSDISQQCPELSENL